MFEFPSLMNGYTPAILALVFVSIYFLVLLPMTRPRDPQRVSVTRYQPPLGVSPGVAAWLVERNLARAIAAALVNMSAKGCVRIEQDSDLCSIAQLQSEFSPTLEREESVLSYNLFQEYDRFSFRELSPELVRAVRIFLLTLKETKYVWSNAALSFPSWIVSGVGVVLALANTHFWSHANIGLTSIVLGTFVSFVVGVAALRGTAGKIATLLPGSTAPQRPWTGADNRALWYFCISLAGIALFGVLSSTTAVLIFGFLVVNGFFFHSLQVLTPTGREVLAQLLDYRKYLSEVDADVISRLHVSDHVPAQLTSEDAFAVALHLDLGWGEQFVTSITDVVEHAALSKQESSG
jgi:Predicted membrane protein (DUF2207)